MLRVFSREIGSTAHWELAEKGLTPAPSICSLPGSQRVQIGMAQDLKGPGGRVPCTNRLVKLG